MKKISVFILLIAAVLLCPHHPVCDARTITIDPGHSYSKPGAISCSGLGEVYFNDALAERIVSALRKAGHTVRLTRKGKESPRLTQRAASAKGSDLFLSIHHDSVQPQFLEHYSANDGTERLCSTHATGYSVFVSRKNAYAKQSEIIASRISRNLQHAGFIPSMHHAEDIPGERRDFNPLLGIYHFDNLVVLSHSPVPAVLIEFAVIVNAEDEQNARDPHVMDTLAAAIAASITQ